MKELVGKIKKITGVKYVLPFEETLVIEFEQRWLPENFIKENMVKNIKKTVHEFGFNMLTLKSTESSKVVALVPFNKN